MNVRIEKGLRDKFNRFYQAALTADVGALISGAAAKTPAGLRLDNEQIEGVCRFAQMPVRGIEDARKIVSMASRLMPDTLYHTLVMCCNDRERLARVNQAVADAGFDLSASRLYNDYLAELGMTAFRLPPLPAFLDWFSHLDYVDLLGDGDRRVEVLPPSDLPVIKPMGPIEAMTGCMMGGENLPDDLNIFNQQVRVAVIDTGIDETHPAMVGKIEQRFDLTQDHAGPVDPDGHGTHVAGIIAGDWPGANHSWGGIAPFSRLTDIQLYSPLGQTSLTLIAGIGCAIKAGVDMYNLSMGGYIEPDGRSIEAQAVEVASSRGILGCIAAGNMGKQGPGAISVPSDAPSAICVAAVFSDGSWSGFSSIGPTMDPEFTGPKPTIAAPGMQIISLRSQYSLRQPLDSYGLYVALDGTSMAAPIITGICALGLVYLRSRGMNGVEPSVFMEALRSSARDVGEQGPYKVGAGIPMVPVFLRNLVKLARKKQGAVTQPVPEDMIRRYRKAMDIDPVYEPGQGSEPRQAASTKPGQSPRETHNPSPGGAGHHARIIRDADHRISVSPAATHAPDHESTLRNWKALEGYFIKGVQAHLEKYVSSMAIELVGVKGCTMDNLLEDDEFNRLRGLAVSYGVTGKAVDHFPVNEGFTANVLKNAKKPVMGVAVKSFAGSMAIGDISREIIAPTPEEIARYIEEMKRCFNGLPCVMALMAPAQWPVAISGLTMGSDSREVFFCQPENNEQNGNHGPYWFHVVNLGDYYYTWLALTPMPHENRIERCVEMMLAQEKLTLPNGRMKIKDLAGIWGLPPGISKRLATDIVERDLRFDFESGPSGKDMDYIVRIRMRK